MRNAFALSVGLLFGLGLCVSGMNDPGKVQGFLDLAGAWDPSLGYVMAGAVAAAMGPFALAKRRGRHAWLGGAIELPPKRALDAPLVAGAAIFGVGWGLTGVCPGPALVDLGFFGDGRAPLFCAAMAAGMIAYDLAGSRISAAASMATQDA